MLTNKKLLFLGFIPVLLLPILIMYLRLYCSSQIFLEPPLAVSILDTVSLFLVTCVIAYVAVRSYLISGSSTILFLGGGVFTWGTGSLASGLKFVPWGINASSTVNDTAALIASVFHISAVLACLLEWPPESDPEKRRRNTILTFLGIPIALSIILALAIKGITPVFFSNETGPTLLRQTFLATALVLFLFASVSVMNRFVWSRSSFQYWYSLGLFLRATAVAGFFLQPAVGSVVGWVGAFTKYLAGVYFLIAVRSAYLGARGKGLSLKEAVSEIIRIPGLFWQDVIENIGDAVISVDINGKILLWNKAAESIFGYSRSEVAGKSLDMIALDNRPLDLQHLLSQNSKTLETELKRIDGSPVSIEISASRKILSTGQVTTLVIRNITERKRAEKELQETQERFRSIIMDQTELYCRFLPNGIITFVNPAFCHMAEMEESELLGNSLFIFLSDEDVNRVIALINEVTPADPDRSIEFWAHVKDKQYWMHWNGRALFDTEGNLTEYHAIGLDLTYRKLTEEGLQKTKDELEDKVRERTALLSKTNEDLLKEIAERKRTERRLRSAKDNLRAMASEIVIADEKSRQNFASELHDSVVQTLGAAKLRTELLREYIPEEGSKDYSELYKLISQSITESRLIMSELSPPILSELGFIPAIEWLTEQMASKSGLTVNFKASNGLEPLTHEVQVLLFQATRELLMNVVKHANAKEALVSISGDGNNIRISVKDNGKGFNGKVSFRTDESGGFGLFSIRERLRHLGGQLIMKSKPGQGTGVTIIVPRTLEQ